MPPHVRLLGISKSFLFAVNPIRVLIPFVLLMAAFPSFGAQLPIQYELIARSGVTPVPDAVGAFLGFTTVTSFSAVVIQTRPVSTHSLVALFKKSQITTR